MRCLAIDPGNVTGVALYDTTWPVDRPPTVSEVEGGLYGFVDWEADLWMQFSDRIFIEDFIIRPDTHRKTREPAAYELLGWVKGAAHVLGVPCDVIGPAEHTPFSDYKKKKTSKIVRLGWSAPSKDMHADSASSILLMGLKRTAPEVAHRLLKEIVQ